VKWARQKEQLQVKPLTAALMLPLRLVLLVNVPQVLLPLQQLRQTVLLRQQQQQQQQGEF
jgi:hypothetical protein